MATLATADPDDRVFTLDPATGILTFGDGLAGRSVPAGYRNVVARPTPPAAARAASRAPATRSPPSAASRDSPARRCSRSPPGPTPRRRPACCARGGATVRSRRRAVAPATTRPPRSTRPRVGVARAHCLPARDARLGPATCRARSPWSCCPRRRTPRRRRRRIPSSSARSPTTSRGAPACWAPPSWRCRPPTARSPSLRLLVGAEAADLALLERRRAGADRRMAQPDPRWRRHRLAVRRHGALGRPGPGLARRRARAAAVARLSFRVGRTALAAVQRRAARPRRAGLAGHARAGDGPRRWRPVIARTFRLLDARTGWDPRPGDGLGRRHPGRRRARLAPAAPGATGDGPDGCPTCWRGRADGAWWLGGRFGLRRLGPCDEAFVPARCGARCGR